MLDDADLAVRQTTYALFAELGRAPSAAEVAARADRATADMARTWGRLHDAHALVLDSQTGAIRGRAAVRHVAALPLSGACASVVG